MFITMLKNNYQRQSLLKEKGENISFKLEMDIDIQIQVNTQVLGEISVPIVDFINNSENLFSK